MSALSASLHAAFHEPRTRVYRLVQGTVWTLILISIMLLVVEGLLPEGSRLIPLIRYVDITVLTIFAVEVVLRVGSYTPPALAVFRRPPIGRLRTHLLARLGFALRPLVLVDILAVLALFPELRGLRALRLLRLLRTSRVFQYRNPFAIVLQTLEENGLLFAFAFSVFAVTTVLGGGEPVSRRGPDQSGDQQPARRHVVVPGHDHHRRIRRHHAGDAARSYRRCRDDDRGDVHIGPVRRHRRVQPGCRHA